MSAQEHDRPRSLRWSPGNEGTVRRVRALRRTCAGVIAAWCALGAMAAPSTQPVPPTSQATQPTATVELEVTDQESGSPLAGVKVRVYETSKNDSYTGKTDAAGIARIAVPPGEYRVGLVKAADHEACLDSTVRLAASKGSTTRHRVNLPPAKIIQGTVVDENGTPVSGVEVSICGANRVATDADGRYRTSTAGLWDDAQHRVVLARDFAGNRAEMAMITEGAETVNLTLCPAASVKGRVVDPAGLPVPNTAAVAYIGYVDLFSLKAVFTEQDGSFRIAALPAGVVCRVVTHTLSRYGHEPVHVRWSENAWMTQPIKAGEIDMGTGQMLVEDGFTVGVVVAPDGKLAPGATLSVVDPENHKPLQTNSWGRFECRERPDAISARATVDGRDLQGSAAPENGFVVIRLQAAGAPSTHPAP